MGKNIIQIVKAGGADPGGNVKLDQLMRKARDLGVPKDIIERNIKRATDTKQVRTCAPAPSLTCGSTHFIGASLEGAWEIIGWMGQWLDGPTRFVQRTCAEETAYHCLRTF